jgi:hypothetical protein
VKRTLLGTHVLHLNTFWKHALHLRKSLQNMDPVFQYVFGKYVLSTFLETYMLYFIEFVEMYAPFDDTF